MRSKRSDALHPVSGRPILSHVLRAVQGIGPGQVIIVIGSDADAVRAAVDEERVQWVEELEQAGTGHAVIQAQGHVQGENLLIIPGNLPLLTAEVLNELVTQHTETAADLSLLTTVPERPASYGRLVRDRAGIPTSIVEQRDATPEQLKIREVNTGIYCVRNDAFLWEGLAALASSTAQGEYYLTDLVEHYHSGGKHVSAVEATDSAAVRGVNSRVELSGVERQMRLRTANELMAAGVTIIDPEHTYIEPGVQIGADTVILPGTHLRRGSTIEEGCTIGPDAWIDQSVVEKGSTVRYSVVESARVRALSSVGPYAHLRPGADIGPRVRIGNFVEIKEARVERGAKIGHLTYIGDAEVGEDTNIGAGTITCNYDGKRKNRTVIGKHAFIGSNVSLVAPITIGEGAIIGAGSTITEDVPPGTLALGRARQINKRREE